MAIFQEKELTLDYYLMRDGGIAIYHHAQVIDKDVEWLESHGYNIEQFDCTNWKTEKDMLNVLAQKLGFPQSSQSNLDGLNDYLSDIDVPENGGLVLVFRRYDVFNASHPSIAWQILDVFSTQSRFFLLFGKHLMVLIQSDDPNIKFNPVGSCPMQWNSKEWMNQKRGV